MDNYRGQSNKFRRNQFSQNIHNQVDVSRVRRIKFLNDDHSDIVLDGNFKLYDSSNFTNCDKDLLRSSFHWHQIIVSKFLF